MAVYTPLDEGGDDQDNDDHDDDNNNKKIDNRLNCNNNSANTHSP